MAGMPVLMTALVALPGGRFPAARDPKAMKTVAFPRRDARGIILSMSHRPGMSQGGLHLADVRVLREAGRLITQLRNPQLEREMPEVGSPPAVALNLEGTPACLQRLLLDSPQRATAVTEEVHEAAKAGPGASGPSLVVRTALAPHLETAGPAGPLGAHRRKALDAILAEVHVLGNAPDGLTPLCALSRASLQRNSLSMRWIA
jgi:hypothetical protein